MTYCHGIARAIYRIINRDMLHFVTSVAFKCLAHGCGCFWRPHQGEGVAGRRNRDRVGLDAAERCTCITDNQEVIALTRHTTPDTETVTALMPYAPLATIGAQGFQSRRS